MFQTKAFCNKKTNQTSLIYRAPNRAAAKTWKQEIYNSNNGLTAILTDKRLLSIRLSVFLLGKKKEEWFV
ncbi:TPA: hypothetical protein DEX28_02910 [Patescibacteria group bacterium]|nr:hypothetical protein [Patescibacteria group bacterium]